ncbi:hypothetical protein AURDEDRAFT_189081 [Auricularia subglabra TFB-10046 SS5]|uniref:Cyclin-like domain-containing protein n=1 Tax=Auricularia subglabra (strain TFB-10046 / SS5) TaxID=717982 RepID=J0LAA8_AURST|nr:hypothetical protein AURDEDRAFT_189081 [Auricularia subglabra TFB-10046 SS5]
MNGPGEQVRRPARAPKPAQPSAPAAGPSGTQSTGVPDPFYGHEETARMCSRFISDLFHCPDSTPAAAQPAAPGAPAPPPTAPPLANFIAYALHRTRLHACVTFTAIFLLKRLKTRFPAARGSSGHRLFISAFMIASKVVCDDTYSNKSWCVVAQRMFSLKEINQMEREMCSYLEWKLNFVPSELAEFEVTVRRDYTRSGRPAVPPIVTAPHPCAHQHAHQAGKGSLPSPPDSPTTPASSHSSTASPSSANIVTPPSGDDNTSIASSKTASSMFSANSSTSTLATSMASSSISGHGQQQQQHAGKTGGEPGFAFATRSVW